jgi:hypothetical protein
MLEGIGQGLQAGISAQQSAQDRCLQLYKLQLYDPLQLGAGQPAFAGKQASRINYQVGKSCDILGRGQARTEVRMATSPALAPTDIATRTIRKLRTRIIPFIFVLMVIAFLDRINFGFAALTMNRELAITSQQFGFLAGIVFFGYFILRDFIAGIGNASTRVAQRN